MGNSRYSYRGDILFGEKDSPDKGQTASYGNKKSDVFKATKAVSPMVTEDAVTSSTAPSPQENSLMQFMETEEKLLVKHGEVLSAMQSCKQEMDTYTNAINSLIASENKITEIFSSHEFTIDISEESQKGIQKIVDDCISSYTARIKQITDSEIRRLRHAFEDEREDMDVIRIRWWPHGYIIVGIICFMVCIIFALCVNLIKS